MKYSLFLALLISSIGFTCEIKDKKQKFDLMQSSHYTGCITGFLTIMELKMYTRPKGMTPRQVMNAVQQSCIRKGLLYRDEMGAND